MIKEALMKQATKQLAEFADIGFKNMQEKLDRVNAQNDQIIETLNEMMKAQVALWKALKMVHAGDSAVFDKVEKEVGVKMEMEGEK